MELGPRALGNRSILADARNPEMKDMVNSRIKFREAFRPFAPSVMEEYADSYFAGCIKSPYMMFTYPVTTKILPATTHIDETSRVQTVSETDNPKYLENPGADDPWGQVDLTPEAKIGLTPLPKIKMTPVDIEPPGDFICIFGFRFGRREIKPKKHEYKVKKHSPVSRIGNGNKKHQQCF